MFAEVKPGVPDGFRVDAAGNLFTSSGSGVQVYTPDGARLGRIPVPGTASNCAFGGADGSRLFVTAGECVWAIDLATRGARIA